MLAPPASGRQSNDPSSAVAVWPVASSLVHVTVVPTPTPRSGGSNAKSLIATVWGPVAPSVHPPVTSVGDAVAEGVSVAPGVPNPAGVAVSAGGGAGGGRGAAGEPAADAQ